VVACQTDEETFVPLDLLAVASEVIGSDHALSHIGSVSGTAAIAAGTKNSGFHAPTWDASDP
jgi:hypothetical protein